MAAEAGDGALSEIDAKPTDTRRRQRFPRLMASASSRASAARGRLHPDPHALELVMRKSDRERLFAHLFGGSRPWLEQHAFLFGGIARGHDRTRILVGDMWLTPPEAFARQTAAGLELERDWYKRALMRSGRRALRTSRYIATHGATMSHSAESTDPTTWRSSRTSPRNSRRSAPPRWCVRRAVRSLPRRGTRCINASCPLPSSYSKVSVCYHRRGSAWLGLAAMPHLTFRPWRTWAYVISSW